MKIAIVGTRSDSDYEAWKNVVLEFLPKNTSMIVSGGAKGIIPLLLAWPRRWDFRS